MQNLGGSYAALLVYEVPWRELPRVGLRFVAPDTLFRGGKAPLFFKVGGTGAGLGFSIIPNLTRYAIFSVWRTESEWHEFLLSKSFLQLHLASNRWWWVGLVPLKAQGAWDGVMPFALQEGPDAARGAQERLGVLTRATIRWSRLRAFWGEVPRVNQVLREAAPGLEMTVGFGELPWVRQATLSIWTSQDAMTHFAYRDAAHKAVVQRTRAENWYKEELFARFRVDGPYGAVP